MKISLSITLVAMMTALSFSAHAIPPIPPSLMAALNAKAKINTVPQTIIICRDINALSADELEDFEKSDDKIVSFDQETRELCLEKVISKVSFNKETNVLCLKK